MEDFPEFMKTSKNSIASKAQSTGVKGWVYDGIDGKQMAYWICEVDGVSKEHVHDYDEYFTVVQGKYTLIVNNQRIDICWGVNILSPRMFRTQENFLLVHGPFTALEANELNAHNEQLYKSRYARR